MSSNRLTIYQYSIVPKLFKIFIDFKKTGCIENKFTFEYESICFEMAVLNSLAHQLCL